MAARTSLGRTPLDRHAVLLGALAIIDEEGLDALSMRRLGQRLDRNAMVLYRHTDGRGDLLDGVVETVFARLVIDEEAATWQDALRDAAHALRRIALDHPNVIPLLATRPIATPLGLRPLGTLLHLEQILRVLQRAGFAPADALHVYRAYFALVLGHLLTELQEVVVDADETDALLRLGLHRLPLKDFPQLRSLADDLAAYDGEAELDRSVGILLAGLATQLLQGAPVS